jgi:hypothetical protein
LSRPISRVDSSGKPICELCPKRLAEAKGKKHIYGAGHICQRCYNQTRKGQLESVVRSPSSTTSTAHVADSINKSKRKRNESDPGQNKIITSTSPRSLRVRAPKPVLPDKKKQKLEKKKDITRALDATHKMRMAALKKAAAAMRDALK